MTALSLLIVSEASPFHRFFQGQTQAAHMSGPTQPVLSACAGSATLFPRVNTGSRLRTWSTIYHNTVNSVIEAHERGTDAVCTEAAPYPKASAQLAQLARQLPPWQDGQALTETDMGAALLEYLRIYECELRTRAFFNPVNAMEEVRARGGNAAPLSLKSIVDEQQREKDMIDVELALSRRALHRTLRVLAGSDRLTVLDTTLECMERASLDLRNALGLAADAAACLPKAVNGRGSLFDLP